MVWQGYLHCPEETPCPSSSVQPTPRGSLYQELSWWGETGSSTGPLSPLQCILCKESYTPLPAMRTSACPDSNHCCGAGQWHLPMP